MGKIIVFDMITIDGYFAGPNGEIDWHVTDEEFDKFALEQLTKEDIDYMLFGRVTYELMKSYWPTEQGRDDDPVIAKAMNEGKKIVVSKTMDTADWENTTLIHDIEELKKLKNEGKNMIIFGSGKLISSLAPHKFIDEYRLMVSPTVLGNGMKIFNEKQNLKLIGTRVFNVTGNVLLKYQPA